MGKVIKLPDSEKKPSNRGVIIVLILLALVLIIGIIFVIKTLIPTNGKQTTIEETAKNVMLDEKTITTISVNSLSNNSFNAYRDGFININNDTVMYYKSDGSEDGSLAINMVDPIYSINDRYVALASQGGKDLKIVKDKKVIDQITTDQSITNVSINQRGDFALVTNDDYYKSRVSVRNNKGEELFAWLSADGYVTKCDLSADGKKVYITTLNSGEEYYSEILCFSIYDKTPVYRKKTPGHLFVGGTLLDSGDYLAIFDNRYVVLNSKGNEQKNYTYPANYALKTYDYDTSGHLVLAFSANGTTHIVMASTTGFSGDPTDISVNGTITAIGLNNTNVLAAATNKIYLLGFNGSTQRTLSIEEYNINHLLCYNDHRALAIRNTSVSVIPY